MLFHIPAVEISRTFNSHSRMHVFRLHASPSSGSNESGERFVLDLANSLKASDVQNIADQCDKAAPPAFGPQVLRVQ